jgi:hypothetical protein
LTVVAYPEPASTWWRCEPRRLARDQSEVAADFPDLTWDGLGAGRWAGRLPLWPFNRRPPPELPVLAEQGLTVEVAYCHAYPMVAPLIYPQDPCPEVAEWTVHDWHVNGNGTLCLLQADSMWDPRQSIIDLLLKAAGWRVEYALMKAGVIDSMSVSGMVSDASFDPLVAQAVLRRTPDRS